MRVARICWVPFIERNIWWSGWSRKIFVHWPRVIRDKWGNCDKISESQPRHTFHTRDLCPHDPGAGAGYCQNLTLYWSHISPGIIPPILGTRPELRLNGWKFLKLTKWASNGGECEPEWRGHYCLLPPCLSPQIVLTEFLTSSSSFIRPQTQDKGSVFISIHSNRRLLLLLTHWVTASWILTMMCQVKYWDGY